MQAVWLSGLLCVVLFLALAHHLAPLKPGVFALQFAQTPKAFFGIVRAWPEAHLERYRLHLLFDFLLLGSYAVFGYLLATRTATFQAYPAVVASLAPWALPVAAAFDALENLLHLRLTSQRATGGGAACRIAGLASAAKWVLLFGFGILALIKLMTPA